MYSTSIKGIVYFSTLWNPPLYLRFSVPCDLWQLQRVTVCGLDSGVNYRSVSALWGIMGTNGVKNGVVFDCVLIVNLTIVVCFTVYVTFLNGIH